LIEVGGVWKTRLEEPLAMDTSSALHLKLFLGGRGGVQEVEKEPTRGEVCSLRVPDMLLRPPSGDVNVSSPEFS